MILTSRNHLPSIKRTHLNQNYETLHMENIIAYITLNPRKPINFDSVFKINKEYMRVLIKLYIRYSALQGVIINYLSVR